MDDKARKPTKELFYMMPVAIARRTDMTSAAKLVFAYLLYVMWGKGVCWTGLRTIREAIGVSVNTVRKKLAELIRLELLSVEPGSRGQITTYRIPHSVPPCYTLCDSEVYQSGNQVYQSGISGVPPGDTQAHPRVIPKQTDTETDKKQKVPPDSWEFAEALLPDGSPLESHRFREAWEEWAAHRRQIHKKLTKCTVQRQVKKCVSWGLTVAVTAIELSIEKGWTGLFEPQEESKRGSKNPARVVTDPGEVDTVKVIRCGPG